MPQATRNNADDLVSIAKAAKEIGFSPSTIARQVKAGSIRSHGGKVRLSEVLEDRASNVDSSRWVGRERKGATPRPRLVHASNHAVHDDNGECACAHQKVEIDGEMMTLGAAKALRETYLLQREKHLLDLASDAARLRWEAVDRWRDAQVDKPPRPEAVRRLVEIALGASEI
jgi:hypothetical protein